MSRDLYLEEKRTIFVLNDKDVDHRKHIIGFIIYFIIFVIFVPYLLTTYKYWNILSAYLPNLDLIAVVIAYHGGPQNSFIWKHLYNPSDTTITGYISSNIINLFALLGVTYIIAYFTFINHNIYKGWSRAFIMLPLTYFIPSNFIIYFMNKFGHYLNNYLASKSLIHYLLVVILGIIIASGFIVIEAGLIARLSPYIVKILSKIY